MADLTVTLTESVTLNGVDQGATTSLTVASVVETFKRIVSCPTDTTIATFRSTVSDGSLSDGALDVEDVRYIRVTNLDSTNPVNLSLQVDAGEDDSAADESATILLEAGKSFIMGTPSDGVAVSDANATIVTTLHNLESILIDPLTNEVAVEIFIASV
jgi:hypothetical protein|tara:strand:- start:779 stop:1252 length:474 start_codon:yes stop_codon:yes gene_type:complete